MTVEKYVIQQLESYTILCRDITTLEFELKALLPFDDNKTNGLIEDLAFAHSSETPVQDSRISDKTATIALSYHVIGLKQTHEVRCNLTSQLEVRKLQVTRLATYLSVLVPEDADVLRAHYFDGLSWQGVSDMNHTCLRTTIKRRDRGLIRLIELYDRLARLGALPDVEPSL